MEFVKCFNWQEAVVQNGAADFVDQLWQDGIVVRGGKLDLISKTEAQVVLATG